MIFTVTAVSRRKDCCKDILKIIVYSYSHSCIKKAPERVRQRYIKLLMQFDGVRKALPCSAKGFFESFIT